MHTGTRGELKYYTDSERQKWQHWHPGVWCNRKTLDYSCNILLLKHFHLTQPCKCNICNNKKVDNKTKLPAHRRTQPGHMQVKEQLSCYQYSENDSSYSWTEGKIKITMIHKILKTLQMYSIFKKIFLKVLKLCVLLRFRSSTHLIYPTALKVIVHWNPVHVPRSVQVINTDKCEHL